MVYVTGANPEIMPGNNGNVEAKPPARPGAEPVVGSLRATAECFYNLHSWESISACYTHLQMLVAMHPLILPWTIYPLMDI